MALRLVKFNKCQAFVKNYNLQVNFINTTPSNFINVSRIVAANKAIVEPNDSTNGHIFDKKPVKVALEKDKPYFWCLCGYSKKQPFCDGTHKKPELKISQKPVKFQVLESKEYWLCNCKQTADRPFCDSTHKSKKVQDAQDAKNTQ